jgi:hypothetical protein
MPIDQEDERGTEKDGSPSLYYCRFCYQDGEFTNPNLTLEKMLEKVQSDPDLPTEFVQKSLELLPTLKRWRNSGPLAWEVVKGKKF